MNGLTTAALATLVALAAAPAAPAQAQPPVRAMARRGARAEAGAEVGTGAPKMITLHREVFSYDGDRGRDPFASLLTSDEVRPVIADLRLTTVAYDEGGRNSVAVLRDLGTKEQYRVKVGSSLGRMRVVRIAPKSVTFAIEEFGFSRQETLTLGDSTSTRTP